MEKHLIKKGLALAIIILFIGVSFQPVFANELSEKVTDSKIVENEKIECTIQIIKTNKVIENKVYLTQQQADELENIIENIRDNLNNSESKEETSEIYNDAINSFNNLNLFPEDITVNEIRQLVFGETQNLNSIKFKNGTSSEFENSKCFIAGKTTNTYFLRPTFIFVLIPDFDFFIPLFSYLFFWFFPIRIGYIVYLGETQMEPNPHPIIYYYPASGWIFTIGLNGKKNYSGSFYGHLFDKSPHIFSTFYPGVLGFTGIRIGKNGWTSSVFYLGFALKVAITTSV
jgi:hypothetical protein